MTLEDLLIKSLKETLFPTFLDVINESHLHHAHPGSPNNGYSHFALRIQSKLFKNLSRVQQHRLIYKAAKPAFEAGLHALKILS